MYLVQHQKFTISKFEISKFVTYKFDWQGQLQVHGARPLGMISLYISNFFQVHMYMSNFRMSNIKYKNLELTIMVMSNFLSAS
jgi:hypothetical protein